MQLLAKSSAFLLVFLTTNFAFSQALYKDSRRHDDSIIEHKHYPLKQQLPLEGWGMGALPRSNSAVLRSDVGNRKGPAVCFQLLPGDKAAGGKRAELVDYYLPRLDSAVTYRFSTYVPFTYKNDDGIANVIAQWHTPDSQRKPPMAFRMRDNRLDVTLNFLESESSDPGASQQLRILKLDNFKVGRWYDFVVTVRWHFLNGSVDAWINGQRVINYKGPTQYLSQEAGPYFKYGVYVSKDLTLPKRLCHGPYSRETRN